MECGKSTTAIMFNMVHESNCKDLHSDLCSNHSLFDQYMVVTSNEMGDIIKDVFYNKSPGVDGICSEHYKMCWSATTSLVVDIDVGSPSPRLCS